MAQLTVNIKESIHIGIPIGELWNITALQFDKIGSWSAGVTESTGHGLRINGAVCSERQCQPSYKGFSKTTEKIIDYDPETYEFTYQIVSGLPGMVTKATNTWSHLEEDEGTRIVMQVNMQLKGLLGRIMKGPMQKKMRQILRENLEELKVYAETGGVHARKKKLLVQ